MTLTNPTQLRVLGALVAALFAAGVFGLVSESGDDGDELGTSSTTSSSSISTSTSVPPTTSVGSATTAPLSPTTSLLPTATSEATTTTSTTTGGGSGSVNVAGGSGLGTGGSASVTGSDQMADTGAEDLFLPGALLLGAALGSRRLLASSRD